MHIDFETRKGKKILTDPSHSLFKDFDIVPSGRRFRAPAWKSQIYWHVARTSFFFGRGSFCRGERQSIFLLFSYSFFSPLFLLFRGARSIIRAWAAPPLPPVATYLQLYKRAFVPTEIYMLNYGIIKL